MLKISNISVSVHSNKPYFEKKISKILGLKPENVKNVFVVKKSIDRRQRGNILNVYTLAFELEGVSEKDYLIKGVTVYEKAKYTLPNVKNKNKKIAVIGFGPAGMYASLVLAKAGIKPVVFERGSSVEKRIEDIEIFKQTGKLNTESNIQFGEGGAGTFSDGKLNTNVKDSRINFVFEEFVKNGASKTILTTNKPHIGTDVLIDVVKNIRENIKNLGGEINFNSKLENIIDNDDMKTIFVEQNGKINKYQFDAVIFAIGHSARDTFFKLSEAGIKMEAKPFSVGFRIEHKQDFIDQNRYGSDYKELKALGKIVPSEYKINTHLENGRGVYTFCMCPGGVVVPAASEEGMVVTNGMSYFKRDLENSNSAVLVNVNVDDFKKYKQSNTPDELAGVDFQRYLEKLAFELGGKNYNAPSQLTEDFIHNKKTTKLKSVKPSYTPNVTLVDFNESMPQFLKENLKVGIINLDKKLKGFASNDSVLTGFETRSSSPVRFYRNSNMISSMNGVIFCGEGSGYAGGITSSALEGIKAAESIINYIDN